MSSSIYAASPACIASTSPASWQQEHLDFLTRSCGLSAPTLFKRIGIMAARGQPLPTRFDAMPSARQASRAAQHTSSPSSGSDVQAGLPVKTPPTSIVCGPADGQATAIWVRVGKGFTGQLNAAKTTPSDIPFGPAQARSALRLDNMMVAKPSRYTATHQLRRERMSARAGPSA
jgi:hypothetical protein